jgi:hypothetical protein
MTSGESDEHITHPVALPLAVTVPAPEQVARSYVVDTKTGISKLDPIRTSYGAAIL